MGEEGPKGDVGEKVSLHKDMSMQLNPSYGIHKLP